MQKQPPGKRQAKTNKQNNNKKKFVVLSEEVPKGLSQGLWATVTLSECRAESQGLRRNFVLLVLIHRLYACSLPGFLNWRVLTSLSLTPSKCSKVSPVPVPLPLSSQRYLQAYLLFASVKTSPCPGHSHVPYHLPCFG